MTLTSTLCSLAFSAVGLALQLPAPAADREALRERVNALLAKPIAPEREIAEVAAAVNAALVAKPADPWLLYWRAELIGRGDAPSGLRGALEAALAAAKAAAPPNRAIEALCLCALAREALTRDQRQEAIDWTRQAIRIEPSSSSAYRLLLDCRLRYGNPLDLVDELQAAAAKHAAREPEFEALYFELLAAVGDWGRLKDAVSKRVAVAPYEPDARHYRGMLAELEGNAVDSFAQHFLAVELGPADRQAMVQSRAALEAVAQKSDDQLAEPLRSLVIAYRDSHRKSEAAHALEALQSARFSESAEIAMAAGLMKLAALGQLGKHRESIEWARRLQKDMPVWAECPSLLVLLGEALEAEGAADEGRQQFERARQRAPAAPAVRRIFRLGGQFRSVEAGVVVTAIDPRSPLETAGVGAGDTLLELDREILAEKSAYDRLRAVRLYFGGIITLRTKHGEIARREMDLIHFRN